MKNTVLLDTHVLLWLLEDNPRLPGTWTGHLQDSRTAIYVSSVSLWELAIKKNLGKIECPDNLIEVLNSNNIQELPISWRHSMAIENLPDIHRDPFDRMILAQGIYEGFAIATMDEEMSKYPAKFLQVS